MSQLDRTLKKAKEYVDILLEELHLTIATVQDFKNNNHENENKSEYNLNEITSNIEKTIDSLKKIPLEIKQIDGKPVQTVAFCGPAKSGKSTMFKKMSGFDIPTGSDISTMSSLAIIPNDKGSEYSDKKLLSDAENIFPNFEINILPNSNVLIKKDETINRLYVSSYSLDNYYSSIKVVLIDLPDFGAIFETNWDKAKLGINRADTVIFTVSASTYRNESVMVILKEVLSKAGSFVFLLTKVDPEVKNPKNEDFQSCAERIRNNLIEDVSINKDFTSIKNADGKSLKELLDSCPFYFSPHKRLSDYSIIIQKLKNCTEEFDQMLFKGAEETIFESKFKKIQYSAEQAMHHCDNLQHIVETQQKFLNNVDEIVKETAKEIIGKQGNCPIHYILKILREELNKSRSSWVLRMEDFIVSKVIRLPKFKNMKNSPNNCFNNLPKDNNEDELRKNIRKEADKCLNKICSNKNLPSKLKYDSIEISEFVEKFMSIEPPHLGDWQKEVRTEIIKWIKEQKEEAAKRDSEASKQNEGEIPYGIIEKGSGFKFRLKQIGFYTQLPFIKIKDLVVNIINFIQNATPLQWLNIVNNVGGDILLPLGVLLIVLDYFILDGVGQLGLITIIGACPAIGGAIIAALSQIVGAIGLQDTANKAKDSWVKLSVKSCEEFFIKELIKPKILKYCISKENTEKCLQNISKSKEACKKLQELLS